MANQCCRCFAHQRKRQLKLLSKVQSNGAERHDFFSSSISLDWQRWISRMHTGKDLTCIPMFAATTLDAQAGVTHDCVILSSPSLAVYLALRVLQERRWVYVNAPALPVLPLAHLVIQAILRIQLLCQTPREGLASGLPQMERYLRSSSDALDEALAAVKNATDFFHLHLMILLMQEQQSRRQPMDMKDDVQ